MSLYSLIAAFLYTSVVRLTDIFPWSLWNIRTQRVRAVPRPHLWYSGRTASQWRHPTHVSLSSCQANTVATYLSPCLIKKKPSSLNSGLDAYLKWIWELRTGKRELVWTSCFLFLVATASLHFLLQNVCNVANFRLPQSLSSTLGILLPYLFFSPSKH